MIDISLGGMILMLDNARIANNSRVLDWTLPFELMCDASDHAIGAVLGQRHDKLLHVIYYASRVLNDAQKIT